MKIKPEIGHRMWYWPTTDELSGDKPMYCADKTTPFDARICYPASGGRVSLVVTDHSGELHTRSSVFVIDSHQIDPDVVEAGGYAEWPLA